MRRGIVKETEYSKVCILDLTTYFDVHWERHHSSLDSVPGAPDQPDHLNPRCVHAVASFICAVIHSTGGIKEPARPKTTLSFIRIVP